MDLVNRVISGDRRALARLITLIENQEPAGLDMLDELFPYTGRTHLVGITGSPGTGKSTLLSQLILQMLKDPTDRPLDDLQGKTGPQIGVVAVDPTSPFSGGAVLGDRVRMRDLMTNPAVFIRSMASRGALGGLAHTTGLVTQALDAAGFNPIIIETVGAGQTEVEIARLAHTVIVVEAPGMGDDIQAIKAGILEIADILVVNKSDHFGAENTVSTLKAMLEMAQSNREEHGLADSLTWKTPVLKTIASEAKGIEELTLEINRHKQYLITSQMRKIKDRIRLTAEFEHLVMQEMLKHWRNWMSQSEVDMVIEEIENRAVSPHQAAMSIVAKLFSGYPGSNN